MRYVVVTSMTLRSLLLLLTIAAGCASCAAMKVRDDDSFGAAAGKVIIRVPLAIATVGISELSIDGNADKAATADFGQQLVNEVAAGRMTAEGAAQLYAIRVTQLNAAEANRAAIIGGILSAASQPPPHMYHCWLGGAGTFYCQ